MERPSVARRRSRMRRWLITLGRVVDGRWRRWQRRRRRLGKELFVECSVHAVARGLSGPGDRRLRAGVVQHRWTHAIGGGSGEGLRGSEVRIARNDLSWHRCASGVVASEAGRADRRRPVDERTA
eukprot:2784977-Pleurochrysis_carterae.AAC.1